MSRDSQSVFVSREFELLDESGSVRSFELTIFVPVLEEIDGAYKCAYAFHGWKEGTTRAGFGVDAVQALVSALNNAGALLYTSDEYERSRITWLGSGNLGLPVVDSIADLVPKANVDPTHRE